MVTKSDIKDIIVANLNDPRILSIQLFLTELITRNAIAGEGFETYRIKDTSTDTFITTLDELIAAIDANKLFAEYLKRSDRMTGDRVHPTVVVLTQFEVSLINDPYDEWFVNTYGSGKKFIALYLNYISDADTTLPVKVYEIKLI